MPTAWDNAPATERDLPIQQFEERPAERGVSGAGYYGYGPQPPPLEPLTALGLLSVLLQAQRPPLRVEGVLQPPAGWGPGGATFAPSSPMATAASPPPLSPPTAMAPLGAMSGGIQQALGGLPGPAGPPMSMGEPMTLAAQATPQMTPVPPPEALTAPPGVGSYQEPPSGGMTANAGYSGVPSMPPMGGMGGPPDILSMLARFQQFQNQPLFQTASQQITGALAGLGQQGLNPVVNSLQQERDQKMLRAIEMMRLQQNVDAQRMQQGENLTKIGQALLQSQSGAGRKMGAEIIKNQLQGISGTTVPPGFVESFEAGVVPLDTRKEAYLAVRTGEKAGIPAGTTDDYLKNQLNIPPAMIPQLRMEANSDEVYKLLFGQTPLQEQQAATRIELEQLRYDVLVRRTDLSEARDVRQAKMAQAHLDIANANLKIAQGRYDYMLANGPEEKRQKALDQAESLTNYLDSTAQQLEAAGYLPPTGASIISPAYLAAAGNRKAFPNEPAWQFWTKHLQPAMVNFMRSVQGDIGPRSILAFQGGLSLMENPPDLASIRKIVEGMRQAVQLGRQGNDTAQTIRFQRPDGTRFDVPWKRGMQYPPGYTVIEVK